MATGLATRSLDHSADTDQQRIVGAWLTLPGAIIDDTSEVDDTCRH